MKTINQLKKQAGFALLDVFLAVVLIATVSGAVYEMLSIYHNKTKVQTLESDLVNIAQAYSPMLNQTAVTSSTYSVFASNGSYIADTLLKAAMIPDSRISKPVTQNYIAYSWLLTDLRVNNKQPVVGFETASRAADNSTTEVQYFIAGVQVSYSQAIQLIQDLNNTFSIFWAKGSKALSQAKPATTLPVDSDNNAIYSLYFITPNTDDCNFGSFSFSAPSPQTAS